MPDRDGDNPAADDAPDLTDLTLIGLWQQMGFPELERREEGVEDWVVIVEVSIGRSERQYDLDALEDLLEALHEWHPSALFNHDGYAVQLHVAAPTAADALRSALGRHDRTTAQIGLTNVCFLRTEILTLAELERSCQDEISASTSRHRISEATPVPNQVYEATRAILTAATPSQVVDNVVNFVLAAGGSVHLGQPPQDDDVVTVALPIGRRSDMYASGDTLTMAGFLIEHWLPQLLDDAREVLARMAVDRPSSASS